MAEVQLQGVTKRYGELEAVAELTLTVEQGEFVVLFGPPGAGKTTTLELISGLELPDEGTVLFDGKDMNEVDTADRNVAMAFENYALYPHMTVFQNIAFPMSIPGRKGNYSREEVRRRVEEVAAVLQIEMLLNRMPRQLSGGQRQRVALGRCLIREPEVRLLDEPIAHLDAKLRHRMYAELKRLQRQTNTTTIYATPAQSEAMAMGDRIVVLVAGRLQQVGSPRELYERPANVTVARFGGEQPMNILPAEVLSEDGRMMFGLGEHHIAATDHLRQAVETYHLSDRILLGIRPPDILCSTDRPHDHALPVELYAAEQFGTSTLLTVQLGEHQLEVAAKDPVDAEVGDTIWLSFTDSRLYVFDPETSDLVAAAAAQADSLVTC